MRKETDGVRLDPINAYNLNRLENWIIMRVV